MEYDGMITNEMDKHDTDSASMCSIVAHRIEAATIEDQPRNSKAGKLLFDGGEVSREKGIILCIQEV